VLETGEGVGGGTGFAPWLALSFGSVDFGIFCAFGAFGAFGALVLLCFSLLDFSFFSFLTPLLL